MKRLWEKHIPTLLGISLIAFSVILSSVFIKDQTIFKSSAIAIDDPQNVTITNISDTSFVLSYTTASNVAGTVSFGETANFGTTVIEDIDREKGEVLPRMIHATTFNNLSPDTKYYFVINSGQTTFLKNNVPFEITTAPNIPAPTSTQTPIKGNIILPDGSIPSQAIAYLTIKGAQTLSAFVDSNGSFTLALDSLRSEDLSSYFELDKDSNIKITVVSDYLISRVLSLYKHTNPLPTVIMSRNYDFTFDVSTPTASRSPKIGGFQQIYPSPSLSKSIASKAPEILVPKKDQSFTDLQPEFRGTSLPNEKVEIIIHSTETIAGETTADSNGNWAFTPPTTLAPGSHTLTVQTKDAFGTVKSTTQSFIVYAAENPTPSPSPAATPTATLTPTPTPDVVSINQIPPTGNSSILFIGITAIAITVVGIMLFLLTRSKTSL